MNKLKTQKIALKFFVNIILPFVLAYNVYNIFALSNVNVQKETSVPKVKSGYIQNTDEVIFLKQNSYVEVSYLDYRAFVLDKYFEKYNSPLIGFGNTFVEACDKYGSPKDCTFLPAIAYVETKLCTKASSLKQFNCWGWGGSGENRIIFSSFYDSIDTITRKMVTGYGVKNLNNPYKLVGTYCGPDCNPYWASSVEREQKAINKLALDLKLPPMFNE